MEKSLFSRIAAGILSFSILATGMGSATALFAADSAGSSDSGEQSEDLGYHRTPEEIKALIGADSYINYNLKYKDVPDAKSSIILYGKDYDPEGTTADVEVKKASSYQSVNSVGDPEGKGDYDVLFTPNSGKVSWTVDIPEDARYAMRICYYNTAGTNTTIERMVFIDGQLPFSETRYLYFPRMWEYQLTEYTDDDGNTYRDFDHDVNGNDIRPVRTEVFGWETYYLRDWLGYTIDPFEFYLSAGTHTITLDAARENMVIAYIELYPYAEEMPYEDFLKQHENEIVRSEDLNDEQKKMLEQHYQFENPDTVSMQMIFPANDRTSAITEPQDPAVIKYNILDVSTVGQFMRYTVTVPKAGLYKVATRFRQNSLIGMYTSRRIRINGEVQFREASYCRFMYDTAFQSANLNNGDQEFYFYFEEGENTVEFEVVLGEMVDYVYDIQQTILKLQEAYEKILQITGPTPDPYREYGFSRLVPSALYTFANAANTLYGIADDIRANTKSTGDQVQALEMYASLFRKVALDESTLASNFVNIKNYTVNLSNWLYSALSQPCKLDFFTIQAEGDETPQAVTTFLQAAWFEIRAFVMSFFMDYTTIAFKGDTKEDPTADLTIWNTNDRETALILRRVIDTSFTAQTGYTVTIKVIAAGLQEAILAGIGPDISFMSSTDTVTWGLRTAVEDLTKFDTFDEVVNGDRFAPCTLRPLQMTVPIDSGETVLKTFGLPVSFTFSMMFYRVDTLSELNIQVPETWDDLIDVISVLQNKNLEVGLPTDSYGATSLFMYQSGVEMYRDDGKAINLDNNNALSAFETLTNFYTKYGCNVSWDVSRFRTGEVPIIIQDAISGYNTLMNFYDLRGLWEMAPILGTRRDDGSIDRTSMSGVSSIIIPRGAQDPQKSWEYLDWYTSYTAQKLLINETIAVSQPTTKVASSNLQALLEEPWTTIERAAIETQLKELASIPEYPGGYIVPTYVGYAFSDVYNNGTDASTAMLDRILDINKELTRKRKEFNMDVYEY